MMVYLFHILNICIIILIDVYMNSENIGRFIKQLREEQGLTQEELANKVHIGREAISKWERGKTSPDSSILLILSEIFNVSVNEILVGERKTDKNITLELYDDRNKISKNFKKLAFGGIVLIFILLFSFYYYYFINQFKSIHAYTVSGYNDNFEISNGLFISTNEKLYFNLGNIENINNFDITEIDLFYIENKEEKLIYSSDSEIIYFYDYKGYEEYFDLEKVDIIFNNFYIRIYYNNKEESIKLNFVEDYVNDKLFFSNDSAVSNEFKNNKKLNNSSEMKKIILNKFEKENDIYLKEIKEKNIIVKYTYIEKNNLLIIDIVENNENTKEYIYDLNFDTITYSNYLDSKDNISFTISDVENCKNVKCEIVEEFKKFLKKI